MRVARHLDLVALVLALPVFVLAGLPLAGYAAAAVIWLVQKGLQMLLQRRADAASDPRAVVGLVAGGSIARGWTAAFAVLGVGLVDREAGLSALFLLLFLFTVYFVVNIIERGMAAGERRGVAAQRRALR